MVKSKYHIYERRFTRIVDIDYVTSLAKKRKKQVANKVVDEKTSVIHPLIHRVEEMLTPPPCCYSAAHFSVNELEYGGGWEDKVVCVTNVAIS